MKNILSNHTNGFVLLEELPFPTCISDHSLHDIVDWDKIGKETMAIVTLDDFNFEAITDCLARKRAVLLRLLGLLL